MRNFLYEFAIEIMVWLYPNHCGWRWSWMTDSVTIEGSLQSSCFYLELGKWKDVQDWSPAQILCCYRDVGSIFPSFFILLSKFFCQFLMLAEMKGQQSLELQPQNYKTEFKRVLSSLWKIRGVKLSHLQKEMYMDIYLAIIQLSNIEINLKVQQDNKYRKKE